MEHLNLTKSQFRILVILLIIWILICCFAIGFAVVNLETLGKHPEQMVLEKYDLEWCYCQGDDWVISFDYNNVKGKKSIFTDDKFTIMNNNS